MNQKIDNLKTGDLVCMEVSGYSHEWRPVIFVKATFDKDIVKSIQFVGLYDKYYLAHINTRHSWKQRVYKITEDNLNDVELSRYSILKEEINNKMEIA